MTRTRGSHAPSLLTLVRRTVVDHELIRPGETILVACSGGPDSTALLHSLALLRDKLRFSLVAHGIDHGLRESAAKELDLAEALAASLDVPFSRSRLSVSSGGNLQARARAARHEKLHEVLSAVRAQAIATGHTADDRAETLLMRLVRGTGPRGLGVLPPRAGELIRPLISARRRDVMTHIERHQLIYATDPSNADPRFLRARIRAEIVPRLEALSPRIVESLCALAEDVVELGLPASEDAQPLSRRQREQINHAVRRGRPRVALRIRGGEDVTIALSGKSAEPPRTKSVKKR